VLLTQWVKPNYLAKTTVETLVHAGDVEPGKAIFVGISAVNKVGLGPRQIATVSSDGNALGSISPRSPPGLPVDVNVFAVTTSAGDSLRVTWHEGEIYGGDISEYRIEWSTDAGATYPNNLVVAAVPGKTFYDVKITTSPYSENVIRVRSYNDQGHNGPSWYQYVDQFETNAISEIVDFRAGAQRATPTCEEGLDECYENDPFIIWARGLPGSPPLWVPTYPKVDVTRSFTRESGMIYFKVPDFNGERIDKWRVEWDIDASFSSDMLQHSIVEHDGDNDDGYTYYNITSLVMGQTYFIRVTAHHSGGYGAPSSSYPFKPMQQPDPPSDPALSISSEASTLLGYSTTLTVTWDYPSIANPYQVGDGGDPVTGYVVEWSKIPFDMLSPTIQDIHIPCADAARFQRFAVRLTTTNDQIKRDASTNYYSGQFFNVGTFISADIPVSATAFEVKRILENMPNIAEVTVNKVEDVNGVTWSVTFEEAFDVPLLEVSSSSLMCSGAPAQPTISYGRNSIFPTSSSYRWQEVPVNPSSTVNKLVLNDLIPGQTYYVRVSAENQLGYGVRRLTAPSMLKVPISQPMVPTQYEVEWGTPRVYVVTSDAVVVKIGPSSFDGGSVITHFNLQWDTSSSFTSGASKTPLGSVVVPAFKVLCSACVSNIDFVYDGSDDTVTVTYVGTPDIVRQLQTGARILFQPLMTPFHIPSLSGKLNLQFLPSLFAILD